MPLHFSQHTGQWQPAVAVHVPKRRGLPLCAATCPLLQLPLRRGRRPPCCSRFTDSRPLLPIKGPDGICPSLPMLSDFGFMVLRFTGKLTEVNGAAMKHSQQAMSGQQQPAVEFELVSCRIAVSYLLNDAWHT